MERIWWTVECVAELGFEVTRWRQRGNLKPVRDVTYGWLTHGEAVQVLDDDSTSVLRGLTD